MKAIDAMGTVEAAAYLGLAVITLKKHIQAGHIRADKKIGATLIFTHETLDSFKSTARPVGRPAKKSVIQYRQRSRQKEKRHDKTRL